MLVQKLSLIILLLFLCQHGIEARNIKVCQGDSAYLSCRWGVIQVIHANYGRTDRRTCAGGKLYFRIQNTNCFQGSSLHKMSVRCDGKKNCSVPAVNSVFSDPCRGTYKYLDVSYQCRA